MRTDSQMAKFAAGLLWGVSLVIVNIGSAGAVQGTGETSRCCQTGHCGANVPLCTSNQKSKDYGGGSTVQAAPKSKGSSSVSAEGGSKK